MAISCQISCRKCWVIPAMERYLLVCLSHSAEKRCLKNVLFTRITSYSTYVHRTESAGWIVTAIRLISGYILLSVWWLSDGYLTFFLHGGADIFGQCLYRTLNSAVPDILQTKSLSEFSWYCCKMAAFFMDSEKPVLLFKRQPWLKSAGKLYIIFSVVHVWRYMLFLWFWRQLFTRGVAACTHHNISGFTRRQFYYIGKRTVRKFRPDKRFTVIPYWRQILQCCDGNGAVGRLFSHQFRNVVRYPCLSRIDRPSFHESMCSQLRFFVHIRLFYSSDAKPVSSVQMAIVTVSHATLGGKVFSDHVITRFFLAYCSWTSCTCRCPYQLSSLLSEEVISSFPALIQTVFVMLRSRFELARYPTFKGFTKFQIVALSSGEFHPTDNILFRRQGSGIVDANLACREKTALICCINL